MRVSRAPIALYGRRVCSNGLCHHILAIPWLRYHHRHRVLWFDGSKRFQCDDLHQSNRPILQMVMRTHITLNLRSLTSHDRIFVPLFALSLCIINQAKWKQIPMMLIIAFIGYVVNFFSAKKFPSSAQISNTLGALAVGVVGNLYSRVRHGVAAAALLPAIFVQVPSGLAASGSLLAGISSADQITNTTTYTNGTARANGTSSVSNNPDYLYTPETKHGFSLPFAVCSPVFSFVKRFLAIYCPISRTLWLFLYDSLLGAFAKTAQNEC